MDANQTEIFVANISVLNCYHKPREMRFVIKGEDAVLVYDNLQMACGCCIGGVWMTEEGDKKLSVLGVKAIYFHCGNEMEHKEIQKFGYFLSETPRWYLDAVWEKSQEALALIPIRT